MKKRKLAPTWEGKQRRRRAQQPSLMNKPVGPLKCLAIGASWNWARGLTAGNIMST